MKTRRAKTNPELRDHIVISQALNWWAHPDLWWTHFPSGEYRSWQDGAKLKCMGLKPGVPDFLFFHKNRPGLAQWIEYKPEKGRLSDDQKRVQADFARLRIFHNVAYGKEQMCQMLRSIDAFTPENLHEAVNYILTTEKVTDRYKKGKAA